MKKWILLLALVLVCLAETACGAGLYSLALVKKDQVNIRKAPGGQMLDRLRKGETSLGQSSGAAGNGTGLSYPERRIIR